MPRKHLAYVRLQLIQTYRPAGTKFRRRLCIVYLAYTLSSSIKIVGRCLAKHAENALQPTVILGTRSRRKGALGLLHPIIEPHDEQRMMAGGVHSRSEDKEDARMYLHVVFVFRCGHIETM